MTEIGVLKRLWQEYSEAVEARQGKVVSIVISPNDYEGLLVDIAQLRPNQLVEFVEKQQLFGVPVVIQD